MAGVSLGLGYLSQFEGQTLLSQFEGHSAVLKRGAYKAAVNGRCGNAVCDLVE